MKSLKKRFIWAIGCIDWKLLLLELSMTLIVTWFGLLLIFVPVLVHPVNEFIRSLGVWEVLLLYLTPAVVVLGILVWRIIKEMAGYRRV